MIPDNPKGISKLRFWGKNRRINGISELPAFMQQRPIGAAIDAQELNEKFDACIEQFLPNP